MPAVIGCMKRALLFDRPLKHEADSAGTGSVRHLGLA